MLAELQETAQTFPEMLTTIEQVGAELDPRTPQFRRGLLRKLARSRYKTTCDESETLLDRFFTTSSTKTSVSVSRYAWETRFSRTVISMSYDDHFRKASRGGAVTLLTQLPSHRTHLLEQLQSRWEGPIIAVIYGLDVYVKHKQLSHWLSSLDRRNIKLFFVIQRGVLYPVNWLRNLALTRALSRYVFVTDVEFMTSINLYSVISIHLKQLENANRTQTAILVPAFEMLAKLDETPATRKQLLRAHRAGDVDGLHSVDRPDAHGATDYWRWRKSNSPYTLLMNNTECDDYFEPYLVVERQHAPYFPEIFMEHDKNRVPYQYALCRGGYDFLVIHNGFLVQRQQKAERLQRLVVNRCIEKAWFYIKSFLRRNPDLSYTQTYAREHNLTDSLTANSTHAMFL